MRKLIVHEFMSVDGVIQAPGAPDEDTDGGFKRGGWTQEYWHDDIGKRFFEIMQTADALLLGRKTWEIHSVFETMDGDPFADAMNKVKKFVVTNDLKSADAWRNTTIISGDVVEAVRKLKAAAGQNILMDGSSQLIHTLQPAGLIDEYQLHVYPVVLGGGKRLFAPDLYIRLKLLESHALPTGVGFVRYQTLSD